MHRAIAEYEALDTPEAAFVYAMDKLHADIVLYLNSGHTWKRHNITQEMLYNNKQHKVAKHPGVADYYEQLHVLLTQHNEHLFPQGRGDQATMDKQHVSKIKHKGNDL